VVEGVVAPFKPLDRFDVREEKTASSALCVKDVLSSSLGPKTDCPDMPPHPFWLRSLQARLNSDSASGRIYRRNRPQLYLSTLLTNHINNYPFISPFILQGVDSKFQTSFFIVVLGMN